MSKRIYKLRNLIAVISLINEEELGTSSKINAAKIGRKSGRVLVTGGEDKKVTMWALGKQEHIMVNQQVTIFSYSRAFHKTVALLNLLPSIQPSNLSQQVQLVVQ